MLQLKHLHCVLHAYPIVQRKGEGRATAAAIELQHNAPARTDGCREPKYFDSGNDICHSDWQSRRRETEESKNIERHKNGTLTEQSNV
jgi:hypothetical protein